jgi:two-component system chemotaxis response regulator CheV
MTSDTNFRLHALANASVLDNVDARTRLAGSNLMELLLFSLGGSEIYGINVFKVREITHTPTIARAPNLPSGVPGLVSLRGTIIPVIALSGLVSGAGNACSDQLMMVTEFSGHVQGFLLHAIDRIVRVEWGSVHAPDAMLGTDNYISAVTQLPDGTLVSVLDVEQVLATVYGEEDVPQLAPAGRSEATVFFADDSAVARREISRVLDKLGVRHQHARNGREAWERLQSLAAHVQSSGEPFSNAIQLVLTDAEMPEMDGYVLTRNIKSDARFNGVPVVMHSSLSSAANRSMGASVGVDAYVAKFDSHVLAETLRPLLDAAPAPPR